jgi:hypothetical protein
MHFFRILTLLKTILGLAFYTGAKKKQSLSNGSKEQN